ncbi:MAG: glycosyltransferase [Pseudomonadota bacterium]|nr:glycosyltransferase [Pseudomonadota bacterium]
MANRILIFLPTYNEAGHVKEMRDRIKATRVPADIMFLDDNSTDGTGDIIDCFAEEDVTISAVHRPAKSGIGGAHLEGIRRAYDMGYDTLVTMDTDLVHKPEDIPTFLDASNASDIVIGTRFELKNSLAEWNFFRKVLTHLGHLMTRLLLRHNFDATGAFRVYRLDRIDRRVFDLVKASDYEFFFTSLTILHLNSYTITEVPIELPGRVYGHSKMEIRHMIKSVLLMFKLSWLRLFKRRLLIINKPDPQYNDANI